MLKAPGAANALMLGGFLQMSPLTTGPLYFHYAAGRFTQTEWVGPFRQVMKLIDWRSNWEDSEESVSKVWHNFLAESQRGIRLGRPVAHMLHS